jgi:MFS family permease
MAEEVLATPSPVSEDGRLSEENRGRFIAVLIAVVLLSEIIPFTYSLAIVITPLVGRSFPAAGNQISWMLTIIGVVGGALIALLTKMGDLWGKKRIMLLSGAVFWVGTLICALTSSWPLFLLGRGLEATAIGMAALCWSLVRDIMPRRLIPVTIGFLGTGIGVSGIAAPVIGGVLTDHFSWRSVFWFMVVYMAVAIPLFAFVVPESGVRVRQRLDVIGTILVGAGLAGILLYLSEGGSWGWGNGGCLAYLIGGLAVLAVWVVWERRISFPVIDLKLLASPKLAVLLGIAFFNTALFTGLTYASALMFLVGKQQVEGAVYAAAQAQSHLPVSVLQQFISFRGNIDYAPGFTLLQFAWHVLVWGAVAGMISGPVGGYWSRRSGARIPAIVGMSVLLLASVGLIFWHGSWLQYCIFFVLASIGSGLSYGTLPNMLIDAVPVEQQGISAGFYSGVGSIGGGFLTAIATSVLARFPFQIVATEPGKGTSVTSVSDVYASAGYGWLFLVCAVAGVFALILTIVIKAGREPAKGGAIG